MSTLIGFNWHCGVSKCGNPLSELQVLSVALNGDLLQTMADDSVAPVVLRLGHEKLPSLLAKVLVVDPLSPAASWEDYLDENPKSNGHVLLR